MAISQCPWPTAGLRRAQFRGLFPRFDRSIDTEQVGINPNFTHRSWPLPLPRTSRAALRSPCGAGWVLLPPSAGCAYGFGPVPHTEEASRIFDRARDAMAGANEILKCACPSVALAACQYQLNR